MPRGECGSEWILGAQAESLEWAMSEIGAVKNLGAELGVKDGD